MEARPCRRDQVGIAHGRPSLHTLTLKLMEAFPLPPPLPGLHEHYPLTSQRQETKCGSKGNAHAPAQPWWWQWARLSRTQEPKLVESKCNCHTGSAMAGMKRVFQAQTSLSGDWYQFETGSQ
eukprot:scaffold91380_cov20-Tisochrysis_lutea.AAC.2